MKKLLLLLSMAIGLLVQAQVYPPSSDTIKITYKDSTVTRSFSQLVTYKVPSLVWKDTSVTLSYTFPVTIQVPVVTKSITLTPPPVVVPPPVVTPPAPSSIIPSTATKLFTSNFIDGFKSFQLVDAGGGKMVPAQVGRGVIADDPTQPGNPTFKASVLKGDAAISNGYRSELTLGGIVADKGDMYYSYRVYYNVLGQGGGGHSVQWHPGNDNGSATLGLYTDFGKFNVVRSLAGYNYYQNGTKAITLNKWYNLVWHVKWSTGSDGIIELYIDGEKYYSYKGVTAESVGVYFKFGINRWAFTNDWIVYYDDLAIYRN